MDRESVGSSVQTATEGVRRDPPYNRKPRDFRMGHPPVRRSLHSCLLLVAWNLAFSRIQTDPKEIAS